MNIPLGALLNSLDIFLLVFTRMTGLFVVAPIFGKRNIPVILKVGIAFFTSLVMMNTNIITGELVFNNLWIYAAAVIKEMLVGVTIGYVAYLIFTAI
ncbi:flagellar biosynthetic protein FliR [Cutibacterium acnes]